MLLDVVDVSALHGGTCQGDWPQLGGQAHAEAGSPIAFLFAAAPRLCKACLRSDSTSPPARPQISSHPSQAKTVTAQSEDD